MVRSFYVHKLLSAANLYVYGIPVPEPSYQSIDVYTYVNMYFIIDQPLMRPLLHGTKQYIIFILFLSRLLPPFHPVLV